MAHFTIYNAGIIGFKSCSPNIFHNIPLLNRQNYKW